MPLRSRELFRFDTEISSSAVVPVGTVLPSASTAAPAGFLICDGSAVSRADYADLFTATGTSYGAGNNTSTFNLPDLRGEVLGGNVSVNYIIKV